MAEEAKPNVTRSALMSRMRSNGTAPEKLLRSALWASGLRYRVSVKTVGGRPDVVFVGPRVAVFVDGCFWHGCPAHYVRPRSRKDFWANKLRENVGRDTRQTARLEAAGWVVLRFWEHEVFTELDSLVVRTTQAVESGSVEDGPHWRVVEVHPIDEAGEHERRVLRQLRRPDVETVELRERTTAKW